MLHFAPWLRRKLPPLERCRRWGGVPQVFVAHLVIALLLLAWLARPTSERSWLLDALVLGASLAHALSGGGARGARVERRSAAGTTAATAGQRSTGKGRDQGRRAAISRRHRAYPSALRCSRSSRKNSRRACPCASTISECTSMNWAFSSVTDVIADQGIRFADARQQRLAQRARLDRQVGDVRVGLRLAHAFGELLEIREHFARRGAIGKIVLAGVDDDTRGL